MEEAKEADDEIHIAQEEVKAGDVIIAENQNNQEAAAEIQVEEAQEHADEDEDEDAADMGESRGDELTDEQIDHLLSTAHDEETEIASTHLKKKERQPVGFPCASRSVFKAAKKVGVQVNFG